jgi:peptide methionine sulfoxide reductase MsrB
MKLPLSIAAVALLAASTCAWNLRDTLLTRRQALTTAAIATASLPLASQAIQYGDETIMSPKAHGTSETAVQSDLEYKVNQRMADQICNYNRHFAEPAGYFKSTNWEDVVLSSDNKPVTFYDSVTGKPLFVAPVGRSAEDLVQESRVHGWPSFRDAEVVWENVRILRSSGETVSVDGTHLGHNIPDRKGNRYCINLVSIAGRPVRV